MHGWQTKSIHSLFTHHQPYPGIERQDQEKTHGRHSAYVLLAPVKHLVYGTCTVYVVCRVYNVYSYVIIHVPSLCTTCIPGNAVKIGFGEIVLEDLENL